MPSYTGTYVSKTFIKSHRHSWQAHLERISNYLILGEDVWWRKDREGFLFYDSDDDLNFRDPGPKLAHFRDTTLEELAKEKARKWEELVLRRVPLPTMKITATETYVILFLTCSSEPDLPTTTPNPNDPSSGTPTNTTRESSPVHSDPQDLSPLDSSPQASSFHLLHSTPTVISSTVPTCTVDSTSTQHRSTTSGSRQLQWNNATSTDEQLRSINLKTWKGHREQHTAVSTIQCYSTTSTPRNFCEL